jgi:hypothetical protein
MYTAVDLFWLRLKKKINIILNFYLFLKHKRN